MNDYQIFVNLLLGNYLSYGHSTIKIGINNNVFKYYSIIKIFLYKKCCIFNNLDYVFK